MSDAQMQTFMLKFKDLIFQDTLGLGRLPFPSFSTFNAKKSSFKKRFLRSKSKKTYFSTFKKSKAKKTIFKKKMQRNKRKTSSFKKRLLQTKSKKNKK